MQCLKALHSRNKRPPGEGAPSYEAGPPTSPGSRTPPHQNKTKDKMLRDKRGRKAKRRKSGAIREERAEEQYNQQRRPKQPQRTKNGKNEKGCGRTVQPTKATETTTTQKQMRKACGRTVQPTKATETTTTQNNKGESVRKNSATN